MLQLTFTPMKRTICALLLMGLLHVSVAAQTFRASVLAGANFSQIDGDDLLGFHKVGLNGGIRVVALLGEKWRVGPEILFSQQGAKRNINVSVYDRLHFNTLEIPLMVYYKDWRLTAEAGFSYQRLIEYEVIGAQGEDITANTPINENQVAFNVGATFFISPRFGFNFRWSKHLADINPTGGENFKGRTISLRGVYTFGRGETIPAAPTAE